MLEVNLSINGNPIAEYLIHRAHTGEDGVNNYTVRRTHPDIRPGQDDALIGLTHSYDDGAELLTAAALIRAHTVWPRVRADRRPVPHGDRPYFDTDLHAIKAGWVVGELISHGVQVLPVKDDNGDYTPKMTLTLPDGKTVTITVEAI